MYDRPLVTNCLASTFKSNRAAQASARTAALAALRLALEGTEIPDFTRVFVNPSPDYGCAAFAQYTVIRSNVNEGQGRLVIPDPRTEAVTRRSIGGELPRFAQAEFLFTDYLCRCQGWQFNSQTLPVGTMVQIFGYITWSERLFF